MVQNRRGDLFLRDREKERLFKNTKRPLVQSRLHNIKIETWDKRKEKAEHIPRYYNKIKLNVLSPVLKRHVRVRLWNFVSFPWIFEFVILKYVKFLRNEACIFWVCVHVQPMLNNCFFLRMSYCATLTNVSVAIGRATKVGWSTWIYTQPYCYLRAAI